MIAMLLILAGCSPRDRIGVPDEVTEGTAIGTSVDDIWWVRCGLSGVVAPFHGRTEVPTSLACESVSATPAGRGALWIAGRTKLIRLDANGDEEDHTAEVMVDGAYQQVVLASRGDHAYAAVKDDPSGRVFRLEGGVFVPMPSGPRAITPLSVHEDGTMWARGMANPMDCGTTSTGSDDSRPDWYCGGARPTLGLRWDGTSWSRTSLDFTEVAGPSGTFPSNDVWYTGGAAELPGPGLRHFDGVSWSYVDAVPPFVGRAVASGRGLVLIGTRVARSGASQDGFTYVTLDLVASRWQGDGWGPVNRFGGSHQQVVVDGGPGAPGFGGELEDGTVILQGGSSASYPLAYTP